MAGEGEDPVSLLDTDGDILWRYDMPRELDVAPHDVASSSVLIHGDVLYVATSNGISRSREDNAKNAVNPEAPALIALDKHTGKLLAHDDTDISKTLFHAQWGSPSLAKVGEQELVLLGGADGICYAFKAWRGGEDVLEVAWQFDCNPHHYKERSDGTPIEYSFGDHRAYKHKKKLNEDIAAFNNEQADAKRKAIDYKASLNDYNASDGTFIGPSEILATPICYKDKVYVATGRDPLHGLGRGVLTCIDATGTGDISETGLVWRFEDIGRSLSTVAIADGLVYASDLGGRLYCLDAETGKLYWTHDTKNEIWGHPLVADGKVYLNAHDSFWILKAGRDKNLLFHSRGGGGSGAIAANGVVYAYIRSQLYAFSK